MNLLKTKFFDKLSKDFEAMSGLVIRQMNDIELCIEQTPSQELFDRINSNELLIDSLDVKMRNQVINVIVLYNPRAGELRKIMAYYDMTFYLERIGDLVLNISGFMTQLDTGGKIFSHYKNDLSKLMATVKNMTQNAIFAFTCEDNRLAKETILLDDMTDCLHHEITGRLRECNPKMITPQELIDILSLNSISYNMERIGDNATNIAEAAIYLIEGKDIKHTTDPETMFCAGSEG